LHRDHSDSDSAKGQTLRSAKESERDRPENENRGPKTGDRASNKKEKKMKNLCKN
jgi:hypothetical protein